MYKPETPPKEEARYRDFGDGLAKAFELVVTPLVFVVIGVGLDRLFDTKPVFTISLAILGVVGVFTREWFAYDLKMRKHEDEAVWRRQ